MLSLLNLGVKVKQYFVCSRCIFLDKKTLLKIWPNPGLSPGRGRGGGEEGLPYSGMCRWTGYGFRPLCP